MPLVDSLIVPLASSTQGAICNVRAFSHANRVNVARRSRLVEISGKDMTVPVGVATEVMPTRALLVEMGQIAARWTTQLVATPLSSQTARCTPAIHGTVSTVDIMHLIFLVLLVASLPCVALLLAPIFSSIRDAHLEEQMNLEKPHPAKTPVAVPQAITPRVV